MEMFNQIVSMLHFNTNTRPDKQRSSPRCGGCSPSGEKQKGNEEKPVFKSDTRFGF
jgi:hypothetical protein